LQYHDDWVCVNKPSGITVHRGNGTPRHKAVLVTSIKRQLARKVFPVHRLDHRTSGAILFAFQSEMAGQLHDAAIRNGKKEYIALVRGEWNDEQGSSVLVDKPLKVKDVTKDAVTKFTLLASTRGETDAARCSLLLCEPLTGRTHQIRRHAYAMGHPIIGDSQHGDNMVNRWWRGREDGPLDRLALHCWTINFELEGSHHECIAPLSLELKTALEELPLWEEALTKEPQLVLDPLDEIGGTHGRNYRQQHQETSQ
jgi:tRNA pseudouridine65 synthase